MSDSQHRSLDKFRRFGLSVPHEAEEVCVLEGHLR